MRRFPQASVQSRTLAGCQGPLGSSLRDPDEEGVQSAEAGCLAVLRKLRWWLPVAVAPLRRTLSLHRFPPPPRNCCRCSRASAQEQQDALLKQLGISGGAAGSGQSAGRLRSTGQGSQRAHGSAPVPTARRAHASVAVARAGCATRMRTSTHRSSKRTTGSSSKLICQLPAPTGRSRRGTGSAAGAAPGSGGDPRERPGERQPRRRGGQPSGPGAPPPPPPAPPTTTQQSTRRRR